MKEVSVYNPKCGETIYFHIGENAEDNFHIIDRSSEEDIWFHVENRPSEHVIAKLSNTKFDRKQLNAVIKQGAHLCKMHSKYSAEKNLAILYTKIKHVKKTTIPGKVEITDAKQVIL